MSLEGHVAIVTGATGGLGSAICRELAAQGCTLVLADLRVREPELQALVADLGAAGRRAACVSVDVRIKAEVQAMVARALELYDRIDILVNNAGVGYVGTIQEMPEADWDRVLEANLKSVFLCSQAVLPAMRKANYGRIVSMGSLLGKIGTVVSGANYAVSKAGIHAFTFCLAKEVAGTGITVNAVAPGPIATAFTEKLPRESYRRFLETVPVGREGRPEDVARCVSFLVSPAADFIHGEVLDVNGGVAMD